jgi:hypothetical protein
MCYLALAVCELYDYLYMRLDLKFTIDSISKYLTRTPREV